MFPVNERADLSISGQWSPFVFKGKRPAVTQGAGSTHATPGHRLIRGHLFTVAVMGLLFALWMGTLFQFCHAAIYTNDWAIRIKGDLQSVNRIAEKYGFTNMGQVSWIKDVL